MDKFKCTICGYIYDPELGDPDNDVKSGTSFEDLSEEWRCPLCGAMKKYFNKEE